MKELSLSNSNLKMKVDDDIYKQYKREKIHITNGYAKYKNKLFHSLVITPKKGYIIDHIDQDKLNNQRTNLRLATRAQNSQNVKKYKEEGTTSKYKGVYKKGIKWVARTNGVHLGTFNSENKAGYAYNLYVQKIFGDNCFLNEVEKPKDWDEKYVIPTKIEKVFAETTPKSRKTKDFKTKDGCVYLKVPYKETINKVIIDEDKWEMVGKYTFSMSKHGYVKLKSSSLTVNLHRYLMGVTDEKILIDHINNNKLDNRMCNLKIVTSSQNNQNRTKKEDSSSIYAGVTKSPNNTWIARIKKDGVQYELGTFRTEIEAAIAYNQKALELYGEGCKLNDVDTSQTVERITKKDGCSSQYIGVQKNKVGNWYVRIVYKGERISLGTYTDEIDAAIIYNKKAIELYGPNYYLLNKGLPDRKVKSRCY